APGYDFFFHASRHYKINPLFLLHGYEPRFIPQDEPEEEKVQDTDRERETPPPNPWDVLEFGENTPQIRRMLEDIEKSQVVKFAVLGFYTRYVIENRQVIEVEMGEDRRQEK
ncbi:MAG: hypothetical protein GY940_35260, partial [bacterium]|nr:hypothetical protein [bacterium]